MSAGIVDYVQFLVAAALFGAGVVATYRRWLWGIVAGIAVGIAAWNWSRGAYSDSGNELGFSMLSIVVVFVPAVVGAFFGLIAQAMVSRRNKAGVPQRGK